MQCLQRATAPQLFCTLHAYNACSSHLLVSQRKQISSCMLILTPVRDIQASLLMFNVTTPILTIWGITLTNNVEFFGSTPESLSSPNSSVSIKLWISDTNSILLSQEGFFGFSFNLNRWESFIVSVARGHISLLTLTFNMWTCCLFGKLRDISFYK